MRTVIFSYSNGKVNGRVEEAVEVEADCPDEEIDEMLSDWLWSTSGANWREKPSERSDE